jgi:hypothetical protein
MLVNTLRLFALSATLFAALVTSCAPKDAPVYRFKIKVVAISEDGEPIALQNATVRATAPVVNAIPDFEGRSGVDGIVRDVDGNDIFQYGLPAVLQITAQKGGNPPVVFGCSYLKLVPDSTATVEIVVQPYVEGVSGC